MSLELDPILEEALQDVHANINDISDYEATPILITLINNVFKEAYQWFENVRLPSTLERANHVITRLNKIENQYTTQLKSYQQESTQQYISKNILEKLNLFKQAIVKQHLTVNKLMQLKANYQDIKFEEELLGLMINEAKTLLIEMKQKKINPEKLHRLVHNHESQDKLRPVLVEKLTSFMMKNGHRPSDALLLSFVQSLNKECSFDYQSEIGSIWKMAKGKNESDRDQFVIQAMDIFIGKYQQALYQVMCHCLSQFASNNIQYSKRLIKEAIDEEYKQVPIEIRNSFEIFQHGVYYMAEWECNQLLAGLHLGQMPLDAVQRELESVQGKWCDSQYIKQRFCDVLENDWNIKNSPQHYKFTQYKSK